ncbi:MAG: Uma2 family endonuclease [Gemmataceae bacterium]|nr:Uma2 family endonuclease [Gemmataceae bacterium]
MLTITKRRTMIGPDDHGRKMSLKDFEFIKTEEDYHYELSRGYITVSQVAKYFHALIVSLIRDSLGAYKTLNPERLHLILNSMECKLLIPEWESERHPDIAVYLTKPKGPKNNTLWRRWIPELTIEVVSERSTDRNYIEKREEYWTLGIKEYWIVDGKRKRIVVLRRGKLDWIEKRLGAEDVLATKLLPGFMLLIKAIMDAVAEVESDE